MRRTLIFEGWLIGWKSISRYIRRHVNTAKKYHHKYGMLVRRDPGNTAIALKHELDGWFVEFDELVKKHGVATEALEKRFQGKQNMKIAP